MQSESDLNRYDPTWEGDMPAPHQHCPRSSQFTEYYEHDVVCLFCHIQITCFLAFLQHICYLLPTLDNFFFEEICVSSSSRHFTLNALCCRAMYSSSAFRSCSKIQSVFSCMVCCHCMLLNAATFIMAQFFLQSLLSAQKPVYS